MDKKQSLVSIIMPMYNSAKFVAESIESVISQTYKNWELIIVDDGSTDGSLEIVNNYAYRDKRIKLINNPTHIGMPSAPRNFGIHHAKGDYIAFLDSDDIWLKTKLEQQIKLFNNNNTVAVFSDYEKIDENGNRNSRIVKAPECVNYKKLLYSNVIGNLTGIYDVRKVGIKKMLHIHHEDFAFWLSVLKEGGVARNTGTVTALYRGHNQSISANKLKTMRWHWNILRNVEKLNVADAAWHFTFYAAKALRKSRI